MSSKKSQGNPPVAPQSGDPLAMDLSMPSDPWIPDFGGPTRVDFISAQNGDWASTSTWVGGVVPTSTDTIQIQHDVTISDTSAEAKVVAIPVGGKLIFDHTVNTRLEVQTIAVLGTYQQGTAANPIGSSVTSVVEFRNTAIDTSAGEDPAGYGNGLIATGNAKIEIHGAAIAKTFIRLGSEASATDTTITLSEAPTGWSIGDRVVIPESRELSGADLGSYTPEYEERTIDNIVSNVITLNSALTYDHPGARDDQGTLEYLPHLMNLTRNVVFESENPAGTRGHILFGERADVDVRYALIRNMGRTLNEPIDNTVFDSEGTPTSVGTNQIARYMMHAHHLHGPATPQSNGKQWTVIGCAFDQGSTLPDQKWHMAIHGSHYGLYQWNTHYNSNGSCIVCEDGSEKENTIADNMVVRVSSVGTSIHRSSQENINGVNTFTAREATGIWMRGFQNRVLRNVCANFEADKPDSAYGIKWHAELGTINTATYPSAQGVYPPDTTDNISSHPILQCEDNEIYASTQNGFTYWWHGVNGTGDEEAGFGTASIDDMVCWHIAKKATFPYPALNLDLVRFVVRGDTPNNSNTTGLFFGDYFQKNCDIIDADIQNVRWGAYTSWHMSGEMLFDNCYISAREACFVWRQWHTSGPAGKYPPSPPDPAGNGWPASKTVRIRDCQAVALNGSSTEFIQSSFSFADAKNFIHPDLFYVENWQDNASDDFQLFRAEQDDDVITPQTGEYNLSVGSIDSGKTNAQNQTDNGYSIGGVVVEIDDLSTRSQIEGYLDETWTP